MQLEYEYFVHETQPNGYSVVEYVHPELGSITLYLILPYDSPDLMHRKIVENFPVERFYGEWLRSQRVQIPEGFRGKFSVDFSDHFYDVVNEATGG